MSNGSLSVRGTLNFSIRDVSAAKIGKRYLKEPFIVVCRFKGHLLDSFKFATRDAAECFIADEIKRLRA